MKRRGDGVISDADKAKPTSKDIMAGGALVSSSEPGIDSDTVGQASIFPGGSTGNTDNKDEQGKPAAPTMTVGANLSDMLLGTQNDAIKLRATSNSLENADSMLLAAILSGDTDYVQRRVNSTGMRGEGATLLLIKSQQKKAETTFIQNLLANAALVAVEDARRKEEKDWQTTRRMVAEFDYSEEERLRGKKKKHDAEAAAFPIDVYGGYFDDINETYTDKFGGVYDSLGYMHPGGKVYETMFGEIGNLVDNTIKLVSGELLKLRRDINVRDALIVSHDVKDTNEIIGRNLKAAMKMGSMLGDDEATPPPASADSSGPEAVAPPAGLAQSKIAGKTTTPSADIEEATQESTWTKLVRSVEFKVAAALKPGGALAFMKRFSRGQPLDREDVEKGVKMLLHVLDNAKLGANGLTDEQKEALGKQLLQEALEGVSKHVRKHFLHVLSKDEEACKLGLYAKWKPMVAAMDRDHDGIPDKLEPLAAVAKDVVNRAEGLGHRFADVASQPLVVSLGFVAEVAHEIGAKSDLRQSPFSLSGPKNNRGR